MSYALPRGFSVVPISHDGDISYDFAIISQAPRLEIRYRINAIDPQSDPSGSYAPMLLAMSDDISAGDSVRSGGFTAEGVRKDFRADAGAASMVPIRSDFGKGYKNCLIVAIHRDNVADAYAFYLFDDLTSVVKTIFRDDVYLALKFNE
jgi:hypothetical protein